MIDHKREYKLSISIILLSIFIIILSFTWLLKISIQIPLALSGLTFLIATYYKWQELAAEWDLEMEVRAEEDATAPLVKRDLRERIRGRKILTFVLTFAAAVFGLGYLIVVNIFK